MAADENFLTRWSRRKHKAARQLPKAAQEGGAVAPQRDTDRAASDAVAEGGSIGDSISASEISIGSATDDLCTLLAAGAPAEAMSTALRRAWTSDPAIRDFIGLSENSWDFTGSGAIEGFGSLSAEEARRLLAQAIRAPERAEPSPGQPADVRSPNPEKPEPSVLAEPSPQTTGDGVPPDDAGASDSAMQHETKASRAEAFPPMRRHGGALPK
jgi:Protein of unknown function (DUF3306)